MSSGGVDEGVRAGGLIVKRLQTQSLRRGTQDTRIRPSGFLCYFDPTFTDARELMMMRKTVGGSVGVGSSVG